MLISKGEYAKLHNAVRLIQFYGYWLWNYTVAKKGFIFDPRLLFDEHDEELASICSDCEYTYGLTCPQCEYKMLRDNICIKKQILQPRAGHYTDYDIENRLKHGYIFRSSVDKILIDACNGDNFDGTGDLGPNFEFCFYPNFYAEEWAHPLFPIFGEHNILAVSAKIKEIKGVSFTTASNSARALGLWMWERIEQKKQFRSTEEAYCHLQSGAEFPMSILGTLGLDNVDTAYLNKLLRQTKKCLKNREVLSIG